MKGKTPFKTIGFAIGLAAGALFVHPYMMLVLSLFTSYGKLDIEPGTRSLSSLAHLIFSRQMLPMSFTFISLCGVAGLLVGMLIERKRRLVALRYENEKRASVLRAIRQLIMVLSHYFLNAALVTEAMVPLALAVSYDLWFLYGMTERAAPYTDFSSVEFQELSHERFSPVAKACLSCAS